MSEAYYLRPDSQAAHKARIEAYRKQQKHPEHGSQSKRKQPHDFDRNERSVRPRLDSTASGDQQVHSGLTSYPFVAPGRKRDMPFYLDEWKGRALGIEDELIDTISWVADQYKSESYDASETSDSSSAGPAASPTPGIMATNAKPTCRDRNRALSDCASASEAASPGTLSTCSERDPVYVSLADLEESIPAEGKCDEVIAVEMPGSMLRFSTRGYGDWGALQSAVLDMTGF